MCTFVCTLRLRGPLLHKSTIPRTQTTFISRYVSGLFRYPCIYIYIYTSCNFQGNNYIETFARENNITVFWSLIERGIMWNIASVHDQHDTVIRSIFTLLHVVAYNPPAGYNLALLFPYLTLPCHKHRVRNRASILIVRKHDSFYIFLFSDI